MLTMVNNEENRERRMMDITGFDIRFKKAQIGGDFIIWARAVLDKELHQIEIKGDMNGLEKHDST